MANKHEQTWGEALAEGVGNLPASAWQAIKGAAHTITHPTDILKSIGELGAAQVGQYAQLGIPVPEKERSTAALKNISDHYGQYMSGAGLKHALATDPVGTALDIAPFVPGPTKLGRLGRMGKLAGIVDKTGAWTPKALRALSEATGGRFNEAALRANPELAHTLQNTMARKGVTAAAAREALLTHHGAPTSRSRVTQRPAPLAAREAAAAATQEGKAAVSSAVGTPTPSHTAAGEALAEAYKESHNGVKNLYNAVANGPEHFRPAAGEIVKRAIDTELKDQGLADFHNFATTHQAKTAHQFIQTQLPTLMDNNDLSVGQLERMRQELNELQQLAKTPNDANVIGAMRKGFDNGLITAAKNNFLETGNPDTFITGLQEARDAFAKHQETFHNPPGVRAAVERLNLRPDDNGLITMAPSAADAENASHAIVGSILDARRGEPRAGGHAAYDRWQNTLGATGGLDLDEALRQTITHIPENAQEMRFTGRKLQDFLQTPLGAKLFNDPREAARLNAAAEAQNLLAERPAAGVSEGSLAGDVMRASRQRLGNMAKGAALGAVGGNPVLGAAAGALSTGVGEQLSARRAMRLERAGAPDMRSIPAKMEGAAATLGDMGRLAGTLRATAAGDAQPADQAPKAAPTAPQAAPAPSEEADPWAKYAEPSAPAKEEADPWAKYAEPQREGRATGGAVNDIEHHVQALLRKAEHARRESTRRTEGLLKHDDSSIVAALDAAKRAI